MCRLAAYLGPAPVPLSSLIYDPPRSLEQVAHSPRELLRGSVNVDGTGVAWWEGSSTEPLRYVTVQPPWSDPNLPALARRFEGSTILASVRSATPGIPFGPSNVAPYVVDGMAGVHNGWIGGFVQGVGRSLLRRLSDERFGRLEAMNDSLALFLLVSQELEDQRGLSLADAMAQVVEVVAKEVSAVDEAATLNLVVATPDEVVAVRTSVNFEINSLYLRQTGDRVWLASEPLDDTKEWLSLPDHSLTVVSRGGFSIDALEHAGRTG